MDEVGAGQERIAAHARPHFRGLSGGRRAVRRRLPFHLFRAGEAAAGVLPHGLMYGVASTAGAVAFRLRPRRFDGLRANLRQALPEVGDRELDSILRLNVRNLARSWVDVLEMPHRSRQMAERVHPINVENMTRTLERGRGVVIVSLHLGMWEVGIAGWNYRFGRMALLAESVRPQELFEHIVASRESMGVTVIPIDTAAMRESDDPVVARRLGAAAIREVYRVLRNNGMVAMAMDRDLIGNGTPLPFFGRDAPIPLGVVEVAMRTGAAIVPVILIRSGRGRNTVIAPCYPEVEYDAGAPDRDAEVRRVASEILRVFEQTIREHPDQWHVMAPIWPDVAPAGTIRASAA